MRFALKQSLRLKAQLIDLQAGLRARGRQQAALDVFIGRSQGGRIPGSKQSCARFTRTEQRLKRNFQTDCDFPESREAGVRAAHFYLRKRRPT